MKMPIKRRLQLYFMCFAVFLLLAMAGVVNHRIKSDFIDYLNDEKHQSLNNLAYAVQTRYASDPKKWQTFISTPPLFEQAVDQAFAHFVGLEGVDVPRPKPPRPHLTDSHKPNAKPHHRPNHPRKRPILPIALENSNHELIYGRGVGKQETHFIAPVKDASGNVLAQFTLPKNTSFSGLQQQAYLSSLKRTLLIILAMGVLLSFVIAHLLAQAFTKPLSRLNQAVKALQNRNFDTRLPVESNDEFGQLSQAFNQMIDKLAEYEAQQRKWLGNISHDLRTPVAVLKGEIDAVQDGIRQPTAETFDSLSQEIDSLSMMLDHFHQVAMQDIQQNSKPDSEKNSKPARLLNEHTRSKIETPDNEKQAITDKYMAENGIDPKPLLQQLAKRSEHSVSDAGLTLKTDWHNTTAHIAMTELALTQICQNLMQNSLRYTNAVRQDEYGQDAGQIVINTTVKKRQFILTWQDSAPSVPTELLDKLTEPLFRVEKSRNRAFAGSGLGLSIVKDIVNQADGELHISQSELGGLQVRVVLPLV